MTRTTSQNAVEVFRKALSFHKRFPSSSRKSAEIRVLRRATVKRLQDQLRFFRSLVHCSIAEIYQLFRVTDRPGPISNAGDLSVIRRSRGEAPLDVIYKTIVENRSGEAPITCLDKPSLPARDRHPHFKLDI